MTMENFMTISANDDVISRVGKFLLFVKLNNGTVNEERVREELARFDADTSENVQAILNLLDKIN